MRRAGPLLFVFAVGSALAACTPDGDGCWEQSIKGWIPITPADGGAPAPDASEAAAPARDGGRRPPVVVVDGEDAGAVADAAADALPPPVNRDDAGASDAGAIADATVAGGDRDAAATDASAAADAGPDWESMTCDRICATLLEDGWVIEGCRPPVRGDATGRLYVYCEATYTQCGH